MLNICLLGTGGTVPLPERWLTSCLLRFNGHAFLIDCGEGTQIALHKQRVSVKHIDAIFLTHYHADHTAGLPGILLTMAKAGRTEPILIAGPKDLHDVMWGVMSIARYVPFEIRLCEYHEREVEMDFGDVIMTAFAVRHSVPCYSYVLDLKRNARFDRQKAEKNQVPLKAWSRLQKGETVEMDGITYTPDQVMGEERKGLKVVYSTDTRPVEQITRHAAGADLYIGEGMYGDPEKADKAKLNLHSTMYETAAIAAKADVRELWLTHYSPSMETPSEYTEQVQAFFRNTVIAKDGQQKELVFEDE